MKLTTLACLAALGLIGPATLALAAPAAAPGPQAQPSVGRAGQPATRSGEPAVRGSERRRRSYAACNRASHARALRGGKRRRFLIRCKLGYERPRNPQAAQPAVQPSAPSPAAAPAERKP